VKRAYFAYHNPIAYLNAVSFGLDSPAFLRDGRFLRKLSLRRGNDVVADFAKQTKGLPHCWNRILI
jgi:hypothetical protein